ncbi:MAG: GMC family oxidoreductase [Gammaproteobacteria bacterium]|nr:GMC family oxidoreductase [Gammaproteobacteria bacterium]
MQPDPWKNTSGWKLVDGTKSLAQTELETDIAIVGTGAGGGVVAEILAKAGRVVTLIEAGPLRTAQHFDMKESTAYPALYQEVASRKTKNKAITILQGHSVGGSTTVNWTSSFRTPKETLEFWQKHYDVQGLSSSALNPWFHLMEEKLQIRPWMAPPNANNQILKTAAVKLGWQTGTVPRNVKGCWDLGYCGLGCPINAKQSMLITTIPAALDAGASLIFNTEVVQFLWKNTRATLLVCKTAAKQTIRIRIKRLILSGGSIESPAILLRSKAPDPFHRVGRRTFLHPTVASLAIMPDQVNAYAGAPQSVYSDEFLWKNGVVGSSCGFKLEVPPLHPVLVAALFPFHGKRHFEIMQKFSYLQATIALLRDGFHEDSEGGKVILRKDGSSLLDYPITPYLQNGFREAYLRMAELQFSAGAKAVMPLHMDTWLLSSWQEAKRTIPHLSMQPFHAMVMSAHVMGGCAMGEDPKQAVVNSFGQHHHIENVWVEDGSLFPTSLGVNPQLTIFALVARNGSFINSILH